MSTGEQKYQVVRVLIYEGTLSWLTMCLQGRQIKGSHSVPNGSIREAIIGELPKIMEGEFYPREQDVPVRPPKPMFVLATSTGDPESPHFIGKLVDGPEELFRVKAGEGDMIFRVDANNPHEPPVPVYVMKGGWWDDLSLRSNTETAGG